MFKTIAFVLCVLFVASDQCNTYPKRLKFAKDKKTVYQYKVVPAKDIDISSVPFLVLLEFMENQICTGSILNEKFVLTAADCTAKYVIKYLNIRYGTSELNKDGTTIKLFKVFLHPHFDRLSLSYDISVIQLAEHIKFSNTAKPIALNSQEPKAAEEGLVPGWDTLMQNGGYLLNKLKLVSVVVHNYNECYSIYYHTRLRSIFCASAQTGCNNVGLSHPYCNGDCHGDRGGPLVINGSLSGIISWGSGCGKAMPRVYSNVISFREFIDKSTGGSAKWV